MSSQRVAHLQRETSESSIDLSLDLDGTGTSDIQTSVPFYDHLLTAFSKHSLIDLRVRASGDTEIDVHHTVEDIGIVLGKAIREALGDKAGIARFGDALVPLDEALVQAVVDVSGRPYLVHSGEPAGFEFHLIGGHFTGSMVRHVFEAITFNAGLTGNPFQSEHGENSFIPAEARHSVRDGHERGAPSSRDSWIALHTGWDQALTDRSRGKGPSPAVCPRRRIVGRGASCLTRCRIRASTRFPLVEWKPRVLWSTNAKASNHRRKKNGTEWSRLAKSLFLNEL